VPEQGFERVDVLASLDNAHTLNFLPSQEGENKLLVLFRSIPAGYLGDLLQVLLLSVVNIPIPVMLF
jgi:hypothetical protein